MRTIHVVLSGGFGIRLQPFSTIDVPKQFIKFCKDGYSLFQRTMLRLRNISGDKYIIVTINEKHINLTIQQLSEICEEKCIILCENDNKNTFFSLLFVKKLIEIIYKKKEDYLLFISPSDSYIEDIYSFIQNYKTAIKVAQKYCKHILFGIKPYNISVNYGYIRYGNLIKNYKDVYNVVDFYEKPDFETAKKFFESKLFLWNSGSFIFNKNLLENDINLFQKKFSHIFDNVVFDSVIENKIKIFLSKTNVFNDLPQLQIDKAIIEHNNNILCNIANFDWQDVGNLDTLFKLKKEGIIKI